MKFDYIYNTVFERFESAIKNAESLNNIPPGDAFLLGAAMVCYRLNQLELAVNGLTIAVETSGQPQAFVPDEPMSGDTLRAANAMAHGGGSAAPAVVRVEAIPPAEAGASGK